MDEKESENVEITLKIQDTSIKCSKKLLINNSDYFKAMLEGNFKESSQPAVELKDVDVDSLNIILSVLKSKKYTIKEVNLLSVLQTSCMLQFLAVKDKCTTTLLKILNETNCLKTWFATERLNIQPLYLKAKYFAMLKFNEIRLSSSHCILELSLQQILSYLGDLNLHYDNEANIYYTVLYWYDEKGYCYDDKRDVALKALSAIDFGRIATPVIGQLKGYFKNVASDTALCNVLSCVMQMRNEADLSLFDSHVQEKAALLLKSNTRLVRQLPCMLLFNESKSDFMTIAYYDVKESEMKVLQELKFSNCINLDGFDIINYDRYIFIYGGEFLIGKGVWNTKFIAYDIINDTYKEDYPDPPHFRRHFQSCVCGDYLFIVGGVGKCRVVQENIFWYHFKQNKWRNDLLCLPCSGRQIKCCRLDNELFILDINNKTGYFLRQNSFSWQRVKIVDENDILPKYSSKISVFVYKKKLYIKEKQLIEMKVIYDGEAELIIVNSTPLPELQCDELYSILCRNVLFTLYKNVYEKKTQDTISLEGFNLDTNISFKVFENFPVNSYYELGDEQQYRMKGILQLFSIFHYKSLEGHEPVNENNINFSK